MMPRWGIALKVVVILLCRWGIVLQLVLRGVEANKVQASIFAKLELIVNY
jgi:hypothetical protein